MRLPLILSWLGLADLAALAYVRAGVAPGCGAGSACVEVTSGPWSSLFGIPWLWLGLGFFAVMAAAASLGWRARPLAVIGALVSLGLLGLQVAVIGQVCPFCAVSTGLCLGLAFSDFRPVAHPRLALLVTLALVTLGVRALWRDRLWLDPPQPLGQAGFVLFMDLQCPHCLEALERMRQLKMTVAIRHFPQDCPAGLSCRGAAICAANPGLVEETEALFAGLRRHEVTQEAVERWLAGRPADSAQVEADRQLALKLGLNTTPVLFVNGRRVRGPLSAANLRRLQNQ